jgi:hypothetical protein
MAPISRVPQAAFRSRVGAQRRSYSRDRRRIFEGWLEARTDADYLQTRASKFAIVVETLRTLALKEHPERTRIPRQMWEKYTVHELPLSRDYLVRECGCFPEQAEALTNPRHWAQLNRKSLLSDIKCVFKMFGIKEKDKLSNCL